MDDGTPREDLLEYIDELQAEIQRYKGVLRTINNLCNAPHWNSERRWKIEVLSRRGKNV